MEINKVQWRMIAKGEKLPCDSFLMKYDGTIPPLISGAGVVIGQNAYYLPVEELRTLPKEESKDERIRTKLLNLLKELLELGGVAQDTWSMNDCEQFIAWLEKQQKYDDKVESKFKVGDWVVYDHIPYQVVELPKEGYINLGLKGNGKVVYAPSTYCRLWTIQDAKDGDVLADGNLPFIFKKIDSMMHSYAYCGISVDDGFKIESEGESGEWTWIQDIKPATKEQRDTLMKAMADAGYTFDFEKKELKKIEQNTVWSEEDENMLQNILECLRHGWKKLPTDILKYENWLKSLRPQSHWKPSDEQIKAVRLARSFVVDDFDEHPTLSEILIELEEQLKKLREE